MIFQSPVCVLLMALVGLFFAMLLPVNDVRYPFVVDRSFAFVVRAEFQARGRGDSHMKVTGVLVGKLELNLKETKLGVAQALFDP